MDSVWGTDALSFQLFRKAGQDHVPQLKQRNIFIR
jgi:hypothetical protein